MAGLLITPEDGTDRLNLPFQKLSMYAPVLQHWKCYDFSIILIVGLDGLCNLLPLFLCHASNIFHILEILSIVLSL